MSTVPGREADEFDARFRSIIEAEFGPGTSAMPEPTPEATPGPGSSLPGTVVPDRGQPPRAAAPEPPALPAGQTTPTDDERFVPPGRQHLPPARARIRLGAGLVVFALALVLAGMFGMSLPPHVGSVAMVAFVVGLAMLLSSAPKDPRDPWDDGARL